MWLMEGMLHGAMPADEGLLVTAPCAPRRRLSSAGALLHPWLQQPQPCSTKALPKERIKQFLTHRKWQVPRGLVRMWRWGWIWCWGSVLLLFSPENRQSPAGPQQADPAVPEPGEESIGDSG